MTWNIGFFLGYQVVKKDFSSVFFWSSSEKFQKNSEFSNLIFSKKSPKIKTFKLKEGNFQKKFETKKITRRIKVLAFFFFFFFFFENDTDLKYFYYRYACTGFAKCLPLSFFQKSFGIILSVWHNFYACKKRLQSLMSNFHVDPQYLHLISAGNITFCTVK